MAFDERRYRNLLRRRDDSHAALMAATDRRNDFYRQRGKLQGRLRELLQEGWRSDSQPVKELERKLDDVSREAEFANDEVGRLEDEWTAHARVAESCEEAVRRWTRSRTDPELAPETIK